MKSFLRLAVATVLLSSGLAGVGCGPVIASPSGVNLLHLGRIGVLLRRCELWWRPRRHPRRGLQRALLSQHLLLHDGIVPGQQQHQHADLAPQRRLHRHLDCGGPSVRRTKPEHHTEQQHQELVRNLLCRRSGCCRCSRDDSFSAAQQPTGLTTSGGLARCEGLRLSRTAIDRAQPQLTSAHH